MLTPIAKAYLADTALNAGLESQMVFGGHGYIREWGMQQCVCDLRISQIYEGTNDVQAQDLIGRKTIRNNGTNMAEYITEIREFVATLDNSLAIKAATLKACNEVEAITRFILQLAKGASDFANGVAVDYLHAVGLLSFSNMFARIPQAAQAKIEALYQNKLILAQYFAEKVLAGLTMHVLH